MTSKETEFALLKADVTWTKKKLSSMSTKQDMMADDLTKLSGILLKDETTGFEGYIAVTRTLGKKVAKLENIKRALISALGIGGVVIGWILKMIYDKI